MANPDSMLYSAAIMTDSLPEIITRSVTDADASAISALHSRVFGPGRFVRSAYRVREGTAFASPYCRAALIGERIVAALRHTTINIGGVPGGVMLGPLAVDPDFANLGYGRRLIAESLDMAKAHGEALVMLVGDMAYYGRLGFQPVQPFGKFYLPGPADPTRVLALELVPGAVAGLAGLVTAR